MKQDMDSWMDGWDKARQDAGYQSNRDLPIYDVADRDMAQLALEKLWADAMNSGMSPEEAVAVAEDRDRFAAKYYDPYLDEFERQLHGGSQPTRKRKEKPQKKTVSEAFAAVIRLLQRGWCQGSEAETADGEPTDNDDPRATKFSLSGALRHLAGQDKASIHVWGRVQAAIREELVQRNRRGLGPLGSAIFNDAPGRKLEDVIRMLQDADAGLKQKQATAATKKIAAAERLLQRHGKTK